MQISQFACYKLTACYVLQDGDLDANWVESMNSVMDDSRLLTLPSNERIRLLQHMKVGSPAAR